MLQRLNLASSSNSAGDEGSERLAREQETERRKYIEQQQAQLQQLQQQQQQLRQQAGYAIDPLSSSASHRAQRPPSASPTDASASGVRLPKLR
jgi:transcription initiation factor TFIID subunit TAF12